MEGDTVGKALLAFGASTAGALTLWWLWNAETRKENVKADVRLSEAGGQGREAVGVPFEVV